MSTGFTFGVLHPKAVVLFFMFVQMENIDYSARIQISQARTLMSNEGNVISYFQGPFRYNDPY